MLHWLVFSSLFLSLPIIYLVPFPGSFSNPRYVASLQLQPGGSNALHPFSFLSLGTSIIMLRLISHRGYQSPIMNVSSSEKDSIFCSSTSAIDMARRRPIWLPKWCSFPVIQRLSSLGVVRSMPDRKSGHTRRKPPGVGTPTGRSNFPATTVERRHRHRYRHRCVDSRGGIRRCDTRRRTWRRGHALSWLSSPYPRRIRSAASRT